LRNYQTTAAVLPSLVCLVSFAVPSMAETDATFVSRYHVMTDENRVSWVTHA
jgi:hypothetical protein